MKKAVQDWELTAYAIDALDGKRRKAVEARVGHNVELREDVYAMQDLASLLEEGFEREPQPFLTMAQRDQIFRGEDRRRRRSRLLRAASAVSVLGLAACLALGFIQLQINLPNGSVFRIARMSHYLSKSLTSVAAAQEAALEPIGLQFLSEEPFLQRLLTLDLGVSNTPLASPAGSENALWSPES